MKAYLFSEPPQAQFDKRNGFTWLDKIEATTADIRAKLIEILEDQSRFTRYATGDPRRPHDEQDEILNSLDRSAFYLWGNPEIVPETATRSPVTSPLPMTISRYWKSWAGLLPSTTPCRSGED